MPTLAGPRYAVAFRSGGDPPMRGVLVVAEDRLLLEGRGPGGNVALDIAYSELTGVRIARSPEERLGDRPALLLERGPLRSVQVEFFGFGLLHEVADVLGALARKTGGDDEVAVVVPLKQGRLQRARELVGKGPPFDPRTLGLSRHEVYLTADEAIFVFAGPGARAAVQHASRDPSLWRVGLAWRDCIGGRPHLADAAEAGRAQGLEPVYRWTAERP
ncbi:MAG: hypothetical protein ACM3QU_12925 [Verrucomicrobiota bacterium]